MKKIKHSKEWYYNARLIAYWVGMAFCVVPTLIAGLWKLRVIVVKDANSTLSGMFVVVMV